MLPSLTLRVTNPSLVATQSACRSQKITRRSHLTRSLVETYAANRRHDGGAVRTYEIRGIYEISERLLGLVMPSLAIRDSSVVGLTPRISAAPPDPRIRQPVS
jgi:hypothetical protein